MELLRLILFVLLTLAYMAYGVMFLMNDPKDNRTLWCGLCAILLKVTAMGIFE